MTSQDDWQGCVQGVCGAKERNTEPVLRGKSLLKENIINGTGSMNRVRKARRVRIGGDERGKSTGLRLEEELERGILEGLKHGLCDCSRDWEHIHFHDG